jgi:nucleotide-binding universal stress UspA family protein
MPDSEEHGGGRLVVGVDGSTCSKVALRWGLRQAQLTGAVVEAVTAWEYPASYWLVPAAADRRLPEIHAQQTLAESVHEVVSDFGSTVPIEQRVVHGHPARVLLDAAHGAELLVVGSRGHGGFAGTLLGSVSQRCAQLAPCPAVVVHNEREGC